MPTQSFALFNADLFWERHRALGGKGRRRRREAGRGSQAGSTPSAEPDAGARPPPEPQNRGLSRDQESTLTDRAPRQPVRSFPARTGNFTLGHPSAEWPRFRKSPANGGTPRTPRASPAAPFPPRAPAPPCPPAPAVLPAPRDWRPSAHTCPPPRARPLLTACPTHPSPHTVRVPRTAACSRLASLLSPPPRRQPSGHLPPLVSSSPPRPRPLTPSRTASHARLLTLTSPYPSRPPPRAHCKGPPWWGPEGLHEAVLKQGPQVGEGSRVRGFWLRQLLGQPGSRPLGDLHHHPPPPPPAPSRRSPSLTPYPRAAPAASR